MKLIIDTDPGDDDILAILLALSWPDTQVLAYIASFGNVDVDHCYNNILKTYGVLDKHLKACPEARERYAGLKHVSTLIRGAEGPLGGPFPGDGAFFHGTDGLGNISTRYPKEIPIPSPESIAHLLKLADKEVPYHKHILDILAQAEDKSITWLVLGPLSSLAVALEHDPELVRRKVARVVIMGGAIDEPGNTTAVAEWNIYADVYAAHAVFKQSRSLPIYLSTLDITTKHTLKWPDYIKRIDPDFLKKDSPNADPLTFFTSAFFRWTKSQTEKYCGGVMELHDPFAAWFALCNPIEGKLSKGWEVKATDIRIERKGEYTKGMCVVDRRQIAVEIPPSDATIPSGTKENKQKAGVQTEHQEVPEGESSEGNVIYVITRSPGSLTLVNDMFEHIWGSKNKSSWYKRVKVALKCIVELIQ